MKKLFILFFICIIAMESCTENERARTFGGRITVNLPTGQKLVEVTWKGNELWYLTEPMEDGYAPKDKTFLEDSRFGLMEGTVMFHESK